MNDSSLLAHVIVGVVSGWALGLILVHIVLFGLFDSITAIRDRIRRALGLDK